MNDDNSGGTDHLDEQFDQRVAERFEPIKQMAVPDNWPPTRTAELPRRARRGKYLAIAAAVVLFGGVLTTVTLKGNANNESVTDTAASSPNQPGNTDQLDSTDVDIEPSRLVLVAQRLTPNESSIDAGSAITGFGLDLFGQLRLADPESNLTVSPTSVAIALAMLEPGTVGASREQIRALLGIEDADRFHASMNALEQDLESRVPVVEPDSEPGELTIGIANGAYLQHGYPFEPDYLEAVGSNYGPVLREVDFFGDPDAVAQEINDYVADETRDQIVDLIDDGVITPDTVLALVNALYLKASWTTPFESTETEDGPFTLLDGIRVTVPLMHGNSSTSAAGDGWVGATKPLVGDLRVQFILPDEGRFAEIAADLPSVFDQYRSNRGAGAELVVPRFDSSTSTELDDAFKALGLTGPYDGGGLLGIAADPTLVLYKSLHDTTVAMDEIGVEASAATVLLFKLFSGPSSGGVPVVLDRPFIYRILDNVSGATLFIGQITNPTI